MPGKPPIGGGGDPTPGSTPGGIAGIIAQVFGYIDRPWKAVVVVVLVIVGVVAWTSYEHRDELVEHWLTPDRVTLKAGDVPAALEKLVDETDADLIQIWAVDLSTNSQRFIAARHRDGERPVIPSPRRLPAITNTSDVRALIEILNGLPVCAQVAPDRPSPVVRRLAERGMRWACGVPIPPSPDALVGAIYLSWVKQPDAAAQDVAVSSAREIAGKLATR